MDRICLYEKCDNVFKHKSKGNGKYKKYCSSECAQNARPKKISIKCLNYNCTVSFIDYLSSNRKYCSYSCSASCNNKISKSKNKKCKRCESIIPSAYTYCSSCRETKKEWTRSDFINSWKSGDLSKVTKTSGELSGAARRHLISLAENKCTKCGWCEPNPVTGYPILAVDHIDGNWKNNKFDNLRVLCYNCHTLTPTFGNLNRNSISGSRPYAEERSRK